MKVTSLSIPDLLLIEPEVFEDSRGFFFESFNQVGFEKATNISPIFVQENHSKSTKGVLRGLHYQLPPMAQDKLVRVIQGEIFDIAVDIRLDSPTFGQWVSEILSDKNKKQLWVPKGFAHGFLVVSESAEVVYKTSDVYVPKCERCICWNDPKIAVDWPLDNINLILSDKDKKGVLLENSEIF
jgi:dTDP-4-dehydrorhamnose 3,5-epimerase